MNLFRKFLTRKITSNLKKSLLASLILICSVSFLLVPFHSAKAVPTEETLSIPGAAKWAWEKITQATESAWEKQGSVIYNKVLRTALNSLAKKAATDIATGMTGQEPFFREEEWGEYVEDQKKAAAGHFIDTLNEDFENLDLCNPDLQAKMNLSLGLTNYTLDDQQPNCSWNEMQKSWSNEFEKFKALGDMSTEEYSSKFAQSFNPESNELSVSVNLLSSLDEKVSQEEEDEENKNEDSGKWFEERDIGGHLTGIPEQERKEMNYADKGVWEQIGKTTGHIGVDTANIFVNQLLISLLNNAKSDMMRKADNTDQDFLSNNDSNQTAGSTNKEKIQQALDKVDASHKQVDFNTSGEYNILSQLAMCPEQGNSRRPKAPTHCVINNDFKNAISQQKTVAQAMEDGDLNPDGRFVRNPNKEGTYKTNYTLRSVLILKKYRILPLGWEEVFSRIEQENTDGDEDTLSSDNITLQDLISCYERGDEYSEYSDDFSKKDRDWCRGLVDPDWVLKSPQQYCRKKGAGHIVNKQVIEASGEDSNRNPSKLSVTRNTDYCADSQSCISYNDKGNCEAYGYCTEEERTWNFEGNSCESKYNTCQTYKNAESGQTVSYLKNTLDFETCDSDSVGCREYSLLGDYNDTTNKVNWDKSSSIFLNKDIETCSQENEGCDQVVRIRPNFGFNFFKDGNFEDGNYSNTGSGYSSKTSLILGNGYNPFDPDQYYEVEVGPDSYNVSGNTYSLSFYAKDCSDQDTFRIASDGEESSLANTSSWERYQTTYTFESNRDLGNEVGIEIEVNDTCEIDHMQLELGDLGTQYSDHDQTNQDYIKMIPEYLWDECYKDVGGGSQDFTLKEDAPDICTNYARRCNSEEVGCNMYSAVNDDFEVAAKVGKNDKCPGECVGYDTYIQKSSYFTSTQSKNFIPQTADTCSADVVGCSEFTNLDELEQGGENREYYSQLKHCIKPDANSCANFYTWTGTQEEGYQLKVMSLKLDDDSNPGDRYPNDPATTQDDSEECNEEIYNKSPSHPDYNPDCHQFYNEDGEISYHLLSNTITCSEDCHPYRRSQDNIDPDMSQQECNQQGASSNWDSQEEVCYLCPNGGTWNEDQNACVYKAIPGEGKTCTAEQNGCREYSGSRGSDVRIVETYNFEGSTQGWSGGELSQENLYNNEQSFYADTSPISNDEIDNRVRTDKSYTLKFLAKSETPTNNLEIYLENGEGDKQYFNFDQNTDTSNLEIEDEWQIHQVSLANLDHEVDEEELKIESDEDSNFYIDNIILKEVSQRYYLIEGSWETPDKCYSDVSGNYQGAQYNLGCQAYTDQGGNRYYLRQFSTLCQDSAVGCELMMDTDNYDEFEAESWNDDDESESCESDDPKDCVDVEANEYMYGVYDQTKLCNSQDLGCTRAGLAFSYGDQNFYKEKYIKNNPNRYDQEICGEENLGCEKWITENQGTDYFKNPQQQVCEWRTGGENNNTLGWYRKNINRCDFNSDGEANQGERICSDGSDCGISSTILNQNNVCDGESCTISGEDCDNTSDCSNVTGECSSDSECRTNVCIDGTCSQSGNSCSESNPCDNNNTCESGECRYECVETQQDQACQTSNTKTIGDGENIEQPSEWAAKCPANESTCTEYIDPISEFSPNLVTNPKYKDLNGDGDKGDGWTGENKNTMFISDVSANELYVFGATGVINDSTTLTCSGEEFDLFKLNQNNRLENAGNSITAGVNNDDYDYDFKTFIIKNDRDFEGCEIERGEETDEVILREAKVNYQLENSLENCNQVNFDNGCVLFNKRSYNNKNEYNYLDSNAYATYQDEAGDSAIQEGASNLLNTNEIVQVSPDRRCSKWLSCRTYIQEETPEGESKQTCYQRVECNSLKNGRCANIVEPDSEVQEFEASEDKNATGYSSLDSFGIPAMKEKGQEPSTGGSWNFENDTKDDISWSNVKLITEPIPENIPLGPNVGYPAQGENFIQIQSQNTASTTGNIVVSNNKDYYLNYLINTSELPGGEKAIITIKGGDGEEIESFEMSANSWERKIHTFNSGGNNNINIEVTGTADNNSPFYLDDISIETVLRVDDNPDSDDNLDNYVSDDCRLYPKQDSLNCRSISPNVIREGWRGYCLQRDPEDSDICLKWYPIDFIGTAYGQKGGYQGRSPLYYCSEMNANFDLMEKIKLHNKYADGGKHDDDQVTVWLDHGCSNNDNRGEITYHGSEVVDGGEYRRLKFSQKRLKKYTPLDGEADSKKLSCGTSGNRIMYVYVLLPNYNDNHIGDVKMEWDNENQSDTAYGIDPEKHNELKKVAEKTGRLYNINDLTVTGDDTVDCKGQGCGGDVTLTYTEYWQPSNGELKHSEGIRAEDHENHFKASKEGENYSEDDDPKLKILDYKDKDNITNLEDFDLVCNQLDKVVEDEGDNMAWAHRVTSDEYKGDTPYFFPQEHQDLSLKYAKDQTAVPFASAVLEEEVKGSSNAVEFKTAQTDPDDDPNVSGLPYSCNDMDKENKDVSSCSKIGRCNDTTDSGDIKYCLRYPDLNDTEAKKELNKTFCGSKNDTCKPLNLQNIRNEDGLYAKALRQLFLKSYGTLKWQDGIYNSTDGSYDFGGEKIDKCTDQPDEEGNVVYDRDEAYSANSSDEFCYVPPRIENIELTDMSGDTIWNGNSTSTEIGKGRYNLKFNSNIDKEQIPLKTIVIDWGDDSSPQPIKREKAHPNDGDRHVITHRYINEDTYNIKIKITDNWNKKVCCVANDACSTEKDSDKCP